MIDGYQLDDDPSRVDREVVWDFLSQHAYWARWRTRADVEAQLDAAWRVIGAYDTTTGRMVGFARAISDGVSFGYLADVFVVEGARGRGLGTRLVRAMVEAGPGVGGDGGGEVSEQGFDAGAAVRLPLADGEELGESDPRKG